jgi:hypothetical protein
VANPALPSQSSGDRDESSTATPTIQRLIALPRSERREALESVVVAEFKATLLMPENEELPLEESYFDLGFTSLRITEAKQRLETLLGRGISANVLFNRPTVTDLMAHLAGEVVPELFARQAAGTTSAAATPTAPAARKALWNDVMKDLYTT